MVLKLLCRAGYVLCLGSLPLHGMAATYYFSTSGSDTAGSGTSSAPYQSLAKLKAVVKSGDIARLKCGDVWHETVELVGTSSLNNNDITLTSYGTCTAGTKPSLRGAVKLTGITWTPVTGKIYSSYTLTPAQAALVTVYPAYIRNNLEYFKARHPNVGTSDIYAIAQGVTRTSPSAPVSAGTLTLAASDIATIGSNNVVDADIFMRNELWYVSSSKVSAYTPGGSSLSVSAIPKSMEAKDGYVLANKLWLLDAEGEWFYDEVAKKLYMVGYGGPLETSLNLVVKQNILKVSGISNFKVDGLDLTYSVGQAIDIRNSPNPVITNTAIKYAAMGSGGVCGENAGLYIGPKLNTNCGVESGTESNGAIVSSNLFAYNGHAGAHVESANAQITNNIIEHTGMNYRLENVLYGLYVRSPGGTISGNRVTNSAYMGIAFANRGETITNNLVNNFCLTYSDCGGIYTYNAIGANDTPVNLRPTTEVQGPSVVSGNYIYGGKGYYQGTKSTERHLGVGVYLDAFSAKVKVENNVIDGVGTGIYLHSAFENQVLSNWVHGASGNGLLASDGVGASGLLANNIIQNNVFHAERRFVMPPVGSPAGTAPTLEAGVAQNWFHRTDVASLFASNTISGNLAVDAGNKPTQWRLREADNYPASWDVSQGKWAQYATDSVSRPFTPKLTNLTTVPNNLLLNGNFDSGLTSWSVSASDVSTTSVSSYPGCVGPCVRFVGASGSPIQSSVFPVNAGGLYYFEYLAIGADGSGSSASVFNSAYLSNGYNPDADASHEMGTGVASVLEKRWTERFFNPTTTYSGSTLGIYQAGTTAGAPVFLDEVRLINVSSLGAGNLYLPSDYTRMLYNNSSSSVSVSCPWSPCPAVVDQNNAPVTFPVTLASKAKKMIFAKPTAWAR